MTYKDRPRPVYDGIGRRYDWRFKCPKCGRWYAKRVWWVRHIAKCGR